VLEAIGVGLVEGTAAFVIGVGVARPDESAGRCEQLSLRNNSRREKIWWSAVGRESGEKHTDGGVNDFSSLVMR